MIKSILQQLHRLLSEIEFYTYEDADSKSA